MSAKKKKQQRKAPGAPKRFKSSYIFFVQEKHKQIQEAAAQRRLAEESNTEEEKRTNVEAMTRKVSSEWNALSDEEKSVYEEMARKDKVRYELEKAMYKGPWTVETGRYKKVVYHEGVRAPPRKPKSAFFAWSNKKRANLKKKLPNASNGEMSKILAKKWKEVSPEIKQQYQEEEKVLRKEYKEAMAKWKAEVEAPIEERRQEAIRLADIKLSSTEERATATNPITTSGNSGNKINLSEKSQPGSVGIPRFSSTASLRPSSKLSPHKLSNGEKEQATLHALAPVEVSDGVPSASMALQNHLFNVANARQLLANGYCAPGYYSGMYPNILSSYQTRETNSLGGMMGRMPLLNLPIEALSEGLVQASALSNSAAPGTLIRQVSQSLSDCQPTMGATVENDGYANKKSISRGLLQPRYALGTNGSLELGVGFQNGQSPIYIAPSRFCGQMQRFPISGFMKEQKGQVFSQLPP